MRKSIFLLLVLCLLCIEIPCVVNAEEISKRENDLKEEEIDLIFEEMNEVLVEKAHAEYLASKNAEHSSGLMEINSTENQLNKRQDVLETALSKLGVHKLDPNDKEDMAILVELSNVKNQKDGVVTLSDPYDSAPDLAAIATVYSVYLQDHSYTIDGVTYNYRRCIVIDNKGRNGLTENAEYDLVPAISGVDLMEQMLVYNFGFLFSNFLGSVPYGVAADWVIGNVFTFLNGVSPNVILASGTDPMYRAFMTSVTKMEYIYVYDYNVWNLIASSADASILRSDLFVGNVHGVPKHEFYDHQTWNSSSNDTTYNYIKKYVDAGRTSSFHDIDPLGTIGVVGFNGTYNFAPVFYSSPGYIW